MTCATAAHRASGRLARARPRPAAITFAVRIDRPALRHRTSPVTVRLNPAATAFQILVAHQVGAALGDGRVGGQQQRRHAVGVQAGHVIRAVGVGHQPGESWTTMLDTTTLALESVATLVTLSTCGSLVTVRGYPSRPFVANVCVRLAPFSTCRLANECRPSTVSVQLVTTISSAVVVGVVEADGGVVGEGDRRKP